MTHAEQEEMLRRALHAVADAIEPAADGLERIRERLSRPRPLAVAWLMAGWTGLAQPVLLRMEPVLAELAGRLCDRLAQWLRLMIRSMRTAGERLRPAGQRLRLVVQRLRPAGERLRPVGDMLVGAIRMLRPRPGMSRHEKQRSALAFAAAALIGAAGGLALSAGLPQAISAAGSVFSVFSQGPPQGPSGGSSSSNVAGNGTHLPPGSSNTPGSVHSRVLNPSPVCPSGPNPGLVPSPSPQGPIPPSSTPASSTSPSSASPSSSNSASPSSTSPSSASPSSTPTGPGPTPAQANASAGIGTGPTSSATPQSSSTVNNGTIATPTPTAGPSVKPSPSASGCGGG